MLTVLETAAWAYELFREVRTTAISSSQMFTSLATGVAAIIIVFKLVRLSYLIMSDEQQAGFGGVRLWQILRPVVILILIQSCSLWVGGLDSIVNGVAMSVQKAVDVKSDKKIVYKAFAQSEVNADELSMYDLESIAAEAHLENQQESDDKLKSILDNASMGQDVGAQMLIYNIRQLFSKSRERKVSTDRAVELRQAQGDTRSEGVIRKECNKYFKDLQKYTEAESGEDGYRIRIHDKNFIPTICNWLYDKLYLVIQAFAEIILTVLAICVPWMLVTTLIEPWKNNFWNFIAQYVQVNFWKVTAACIHFATVSFRGGAVYLALNADWAGVNNTVSTASSGADAGITLSAIISIAGVFALLKVADITAAYIPSSGGSIGSAAGGAGTAMAPISAAANTAKAAAGAVIK